MTENSSLAGAVSTRSLEGEALLAALSARARPGERPEELLFDLGLLASRDYALELAMRSNMPYLGLRGFLVDERLLLYITLSVAAAERVCPVVMVGDSLKVASAFRDPDLTSVRSRFPRLDLELVLSPRDEILQALRDVSFAAR
ncbi:MAG TPA: hypothetical protein VIL98_10085 [Gaiellaceae bacterium]